MRRRFVFLLIPLLLLTLAASAHALPYSYATTYAYGNSNISPPSPLSDSETLSSSGGAPLTSESSMFASNELWSLSAYASTQVQAGLIQLYASGVASAVDNGPPAYVTAVAHASSSGRWQDTFTIDGGSLNGQVGQLVAGFRVDGELASSFDSSVNFSAYMDEQFRAWIRLTNSATGQDVWEKGGERHLVDYNGDRLLQTGMPLRDPGLWLITLNFKFGTPIQLDMWGDVYGYADALALDSTSHYYPDSAISATADFAHAMNWDGFLSLTDLSGNPVSNYTVSSDSGFDYRYSAAPVPEPASMLLLGSGLIGLAGLKRRFRK